MVEITRDAGQLWKGYKKSDPLMMRKSFSMKDVFYRKSEPAKELWHAELSFDYNFYFVVIAAAALLLAVMTAMCRMRKTMRRRGKKRA